MKKKLPLYVKILIGMALGVAVGLGAVALDWGHVVKDWIAPFGTIFIRLLKLVAVPLVFLSLLKGVAHLHDMRRLSRMAFKTVFIYVTTTIIAILIGIGLVSAIRPGSFFPAEKAAEIQAVYGNSIVNPEAVAEAEKSGPLQFVVDMVPENVFAAAGNNGMMLQIIFIALLFGVAIVALPRKTTQPVLDVVDGLNEIVLKVIHYAMLFAPYGVLALMAELIVGFGGESAVFSALGMYILTLLLGFAVLLFLFYPLLVKLFTNTPIRKFFKALTPVQLLAFSTSSSSATLPVTMEQVEKELGVSNDTASFVLPLGATINMNGTSCYQAVAVFFIAQVMGLEFTFTQTVTIVLMATISAIGTPGIPGGSIVILMMVLSSVGIPAEWLALILGVDRPLDMARTVVNVTGDTVAALIVDKGEKTLPE